MEVLLVKMSSMGDLIHTLPALSDAAAAIPSIRFTWVAEQSFAEVPSWHPSVNGIIKLRWRFWRKHLLQKDTWKEMRLFYQQLRAKKYDLVIDAQGLVKSMVVARLAKGIIHGSDRETARESWASYGYQVHHHIDWSQSAIDRMRQLFAKSLCYPQPNTPPNFGIDPNLLPQLTLSFKQAFLSGLNPAHGQSPLLGIKGENHDSPPCNPPSREVRFPSAEIPAFLLFFHGTTWITKHWPEENWAKLIKLATDEGLTVLLPWGNDEEKARAERLAQVSPLAQVLPKLKIAEIGRLITQAAGVVCLDSGLSHLTAALSAPLVGIYGPTDPELLGLKGPKMAYLRPAGFQCPGCTRDQCQHPQAKPGFPACYIDTTPQKVWETLQGKMNIYEKV